MNRLCANESVSSRTKLTWFNVSWWLILDNWNKWDKKPVRYAPGKHRFHMTELLIAPLLPLYVQLNHIPAYSLALVDWNLKVLINARVSLLHLLPPIRKACERTLRMSWNEPPYQSDCWVFGLRRCLTCDIRLFGKGVRLAWSGSYVSSEGSHRQQSAAAGFRRVTLDEHLRTIWKGHV